MKRILRFLLKIFLIVFVLLNIILAFHAYKFTHFYDESEITIKRPEEMGGWDKTKTMLFGINAVKSKNLVAPDVNYEVIKLETDDELQLEGWYLPVDSAKGTVIMFHGHGSSKSKILDEAYYIRSLGFNILLMDFRAHGGSGGNVCTIGVKEALDVKLAYEHIQSRGEKNIVLWGVSLGAATVTHAINEYKLQPAKVILDMPFGSLVEAVEGRMKMMGLPAEPLSRMLTFWGGAENGFWAYKMKPCEDAKSITCPALLEWGAKDPRVTKKETDCIYNNLASAKKSLVVYETAAHESFCKKENEKWRTTMKSFLLN
jgi:alpha-beta hydrolase superfamily lysophospholipase